MLPVSMKVLSQESKQDWQTPKWVFDTLNTKYGPFTLDAAASNTNALCTNYFTVEIDALRQPWEGKVFCNPPFQKIRPWVEKAKESILSGSCDVVCLVLPANVGTSWYVDYAPYCYTEFTWPRINFVDPERPNKKGAPASTMLLIFTPESVRNPQSNPLRISHVEYRP